MKFKAFFQLFFALIILLIFSTKAFAVTVSINNPPSTINTQDPFPVNVSVSGANAGDNYLRVELYKNNTINYFGETLNNNNNWYGGADGTQCFKVTIQSGATLNQTIQGRVGNPSATDFTGTGTYMLRVRRYTASGTPGSSDIINPVAINIIITNPTQLNPTNTPTPPSTPSATPTSVPSQSPIPSNPFNSSPTITDTPTATPTPIPSDQIPTFTPTPSPTDAIPTDQSEGNSVPTPTPINSPTQIIYPSFPTSLISQSADIRFGAVLGTSSGGLKIDKKPNIHKVKKKENQNFSLLIIIAGFGLLVSCGILIVLKTQRGNELWKKFF